MKNDGQVVTGNGKYRALKDDEKAPIIKLYHNLLEPVNYGMIRVDDILDESEAVREGVETALAWDPMLTGYPVIAVTADTTLFKHIRDDLKLRLDRFYVDKLNNLRDFVFWWYLNYELPILKALPVAACLCSITFRPGWTKCELSGLISFQSGVSIFVSLSVFP